MKYQIYENFLAINSFKEIKNIVLGIDFPWRRRDHMVEGTKNAMYFNYCFYNEMVTTSELYEPHIVPILKKLKAKAPIQVRANLTISALFKKSKWHCDYDFMCKTAILYLNDCDGGTDIMINNKTIFIKAVANKMLVFDTDVMHRAVTSKKEPIRYIINFNYFTS